MRYFFHLRGSSDNLFDLEGLELHDLETVRKCTLHTVRDMLSHDIKNGHLDLRYRVDVEDEGGTLVHSLSFNEAFEVTDR